MDRFARHVLGYHGCEAAFARKLLDGSVPIDEWNPSTNQYDWLGHGIYFWEHSPWRAARWAKERCASMGVETAVVGAVIQLGRCFDLLNEQITGLLADEYNLLAKDFADENLPLPKNCGPNGGKRDLDCLVINDCLSRLRAQGNEHDTVRGAFSEGSDVYPGSGFTRETHIQIAVKKSACILGVFRPNLTS